MGFAMVIDLNKCIGCQTCTVACKRLWTSNEGQENTWFNHVETVPGRGWPRDFKSSTPDHGVYAGEGGKGRLPMIEDTGGRWQFNLDDLKPGHFDPQKPLQPKTMENGKAPSWGPNWEEDEGAGVFPNSFFFYMPRLCNHCEDPACKKACPRSAITKRADGIVLIDEPNCRGYRLCVEACPYKKIYFNPALGVSQKCIFCFPRVEKGMPPACVGQCAGRARHFGLLEDPESPTHRIVKKFGVALPLFAEKGTQPNVFYIPPFSATGFNPDGTPNNTPRIPMDYLKDLFGDEVEGVMAKLTEERAKKSRGESSEIMDELIRYTFNDSWKLPAEQEFGKHT